YKGDFGCRGFALTSVLSKPGTPGGNDNTFPVSHPRFGRVANGGATKHILSHMRASSRVGNTSPDEGM
ncbi:hypothetical protein, partial [Serratia nevei]|uniref:hypothetical protein n=1 Tax=Serratia nevei TaxID=2703794 RepID=UPI00249B058D